jgi:hypothetical protein
LTFLLRLVSAGGWLANMANQASGLRAPNIGHDESVRPRMIWAWIVCLVIVGIGLGYDLLRVPSPVTASIALAAPAIAALMLAGWRAGLVPFVADPRPMVTTAAASAPTETSATDATVAVRITGVVEDEHRLLRRYRYRRATLEGGRVEVQGLGGGGRHEIVPVRPDFGLESISNTTRGTAWLLTGGRPAMRLERHVGPVVLTFDQVATRDAIFDRIDRGDWPARPIDDRDSGD